MKRISLLFPIIVLLCSCTSVKFNPRYEQQQWHTVIVAPFSGDSSERTVSKRIDYQLSTLAGITVIPSYNVDMLLKQHDLQEQYEQHPREALFELAKKVKADGVIEGEVISNHSNRSQAFHQVEITSRIVDINNLAIVSTSYEQNSSLIGSLNDLSKQSTDEIIAELQIALAKLGAQLP
ncbi:hypothetical protein [Pseudoalteromonas sp. SW0106-04]|uniref:hypothetical protein n=1 Tax=Pseudoalteromonas sp. SW0106-04 TaxID=1702169 RepID=UPI0012F86DAE|nr:hypothetical protein [Pseudoalteromonas sp. SW0106-04]